MDKPVVDSADVRTPLSGSQDWTSTEKLGAPSAAAAATGDSATVGAAVAMGGDLVEKTAAETSEGAAEAEAAEGIAVRSPIELDGESVVSLRASSLLGAQALRASTSQSMSQELSTAAGPLGPPRQRCRERGPLFLGMIGG